MVMDVLEVLEKFIIQRYDTTKDTYGQWKINRRHCTHACVLHKRKGIADSNLDTYLSPAHDSVPLSLLEAHRSNLICRTISRIRYKPQSRGNGLIAIAHLILPKELHPRSFCGFNVSNLVHIQ